MRGNHFLVHWTHTRFTSVFMHFSSFKYVVIIFLRNQTINITFLYRYSCLNYSFRQVLSNSQLCALVSLNHRLGAYEPNGVTTWPHSQLTMKATIIDLIQRHTCKQTNQTLTLAKNSPFYIRLVYNKMLINYSLKVNKNGHGHNMCFVNPSV